MADTSFMRWALRQFYTKTQIDSGTLDAYYFGEDEFLSTSAGAGDAGKPIKLDAGGHVDATMINDADIDHTLITNIGTNTHAQIDTHIAATAAHGATGAVVGTTNTQTLTNKTLTAPVIATISNTGTLTLPTSTDTLVGRATTDTLTNKTLTSPTLTTPTVSSGTLAVSTTGESVAIGGSNTTTYMNIAGTRSYIGYDASGNNIVLQGGVNKGIAFAVHNATFASGTVATIDTSGNFNTTGNITQNSVAVVTTTGTQTLTNKTLTAPIIATISNSGTLTLPTSTDTLVGRATTDTLTNKTLTSPTINTPTIGTSAVVPLVYGSTSANGDITIHGTSSATKASSYVLLNPSGGGVGIGTSDPGGHPLVVGDGASNYIFIFDPDGGTGSTPKITSYDTVGAGTAHLTIAANQLRLVPNTKGLILDAQATPSSATDTGSAGAFCWDSSYFYICTSTNVWRRVAHSTF